MAIYGNLWPSISFNPGYARITDSMAHPPGQNPPSGLIIDPTDYPDFPTNYCHAWIRKSDMPDAMRASHTEETDTYINFVYDDEDVNANYPLGFVTRGYNSLPVSSTDNYVSAVWRGYRGGGGDPWWGGFYDTCFFNELDLGYTDCFFWDVYFSVFYWNDNGSSVGNVSREVVNINQGGNQFWYNFLWGGATITTTILNLNANISFTAADLEENGFVDLTSQLPENSGYNHMVGFINNYFIAGSSEQNQNGNGFKPLPTTIYNSQYWQAESDTTTYNYNSLRGSRAGFKARNSYNNNTSGIGDGAGFLANGMIYSDDLSAMSNMDPTKSYRGSFMGGLHGSILKSDLDDVNNRIIAYVTDGNVFIVKQSAVTSYFGPYTIFKLIKPSEMRWHLCLFPRFNLDTTFSVSGGYGYDTDKDVYPEYDENDRCTGNLLIGRSEILAKGRPWQLGSIEDTTFDPDEMPKPSDENPDAEESGISVPIQRRLSMGAVSSFITCYGLTAAQIQEFGRLLWSSWVDQGGLVMAMVENFKFLIDSGIASNTGSIDISSVLDFIISLKVYPFDIRYMYAFSNSGNDGKIYIGRGTYGLEVSQNAIYKAINQIGYLNAGTYNVPRPFGDFRDYTNINITVYVPYCGTIELNPADVVGRTLSGTYAIDVMTGECTFYLEVIATDDSGEHRYLVGTIDGQLGVTIPVSATNSGQIAARRFSDVMQFASTVTGFFNRNMQIGQNIGMQMATLGASGISSKNPEMANVRQQNIKISGSQDYANNALGLFKDVEGQFENSLTRAAIDAPSISGGSGIASFAHPDSVWIQIRHGIYPTVNNYNHTVGKVSTKSAHLSEYSGFTVCQNVDVSGLSCTEEEKSAIKQLLETGIFI